MRVVALTLCVAAVVACGSLEQPGDDLDVRDELQAHFALVEAELRAAPPRDLAPDVAERRATLLDALHAYSAAARFPHNHAKPGRSAVFIDPHGTTCAVAELLMQSGDAALAAAIARDDNFVRLPSSDARLLAWAARNGFTMPELARIQPTYEWENEVKGLDDQVCAFGTAGDAAGAVAFVDGTKRYTYENKRRTGEREMKGNERDALLDWAVRCAARTDHKDATFALLDRAAATDPLETALHEALLAGHMALTQALLARAQEKNLLHMVRGSVLYDAVAVGELPLVKIMVDDGAHVRSHPGEADLVFVALQNGHPWVAIWLLNHGGGARGAGPVELTTVDAADATSLQLAVLQGHAVAVKALLDAGAPRTAITLRDRRTMSLAELARISGNSDVAALVAAE